MSKLQAVLLITCSFFLGITQAQNLNGDESVSAFISVDVISMETDDILRDQTVIIRNGIIKEIGPADNIDVPQKARKIDGSGFYLLPGLTDAHVHLRSTDELISYLNYGVTTIVNLSGGTSGAPDLLQYKKRIENGCLIGPSLFTSGPILDGDPLIFASVSRKVTTPEEGERIVVQQKKAGYDFIKVYNNITPDVLTSIVNTADENELAVFGHIPRKTGRADALQNALTAGLDVIAHGEEFFFTYFHGSVDNLLDEGKIPHPDESRIPEAVRLTKEAGAVVTPNLSFVAMTRKLLDSLNVVLNNPETKYLSPAVMEMWREQNPTNRSDLERFDTRELAKFAFLKKLTKALHDAGVRLLLGTDSSAPGLFPGLSAHVELRELVESGLSPYEALLTGTRNTGEFIKNNVSSSEPFGIVAPGYKADLILVEENPLNDISRLKSIRGVMTRGKWYTKSELEKIREKIAESYDG